MIVKVTLIRRFAAHLVAVMLVLALYTLARLPEISRAERTDLAARFRFHQMPLPQFQGSPPPKSLRAVHPSLQRISGWISSVGAAIALNDMDGDGLANDLCHVDTRADQVIVAPVPGTPARYEPFALDSGRGLFDPATMAPMGCLPGDLNEDGLMDMLVYYWGRTPVAFLRTGQAASGGVTLARENYLAVEVAPGGERWYTNAATLADLDGDGHLDLIIGNYFPDGARILDAHAGGREQMQHSMSRAFNGGRNRLLRWEGATPGAQASVRFKMVEGAIEGDADDSISRAWTLAVGAADLDGDLLPELYFANDFGPDRLLHNRSTPGQFRFAPLEGVRTLGMPKSKVIGQDSFKGMGVDFGDLNGDGLLDILISNISDPYALEESNFVFLSTGETERMAQGIAPYVDGSESLGLSRSGWSWDVKLADFNNDGVLEVLQATGFIKGDVKRWPELHELAMGNDQLLDHPGNWPRFQAGDGLSDHGHNPFYARARNGLYCDIAAELGLDQSYISRGIAIADVDGDGRLDFAVANQWDTSYFYHNQSEGTQPFLAFHLMLPLAGSESEKTELSAGRPRAGVQARPAIGACATVHLPDGRQLVAQVDGGSGHSGKRSPNLHFGLGELARDEKVAVEVRWRDPDGQTRQEAFQVSPGEYTVQLGWSAQRRLANDKR